MDNEFVLGSRVLAHHKDEAYTATVMRKGILYTGPSIAYGRKAMVSENTKVTVIEKKDNWSLIKYVIGNNDYIGWVESNTIEKDASTTV